MLLCTLVKAAEYKDLIFWVKGSLGICQEKKHVSIWGDET